MPGTDAWYDDASYARYQADTGDDIVTVPYDPTRGENPAGEDCPWCLDPDSDVIPEDTDDAAYLLCLTHLLEYTGESRS
jgi:hypothetical protein